MLTCITSGPTEVEKLIDKAHVCSGGHFGVLTRVYCHSTGPIMASTEHGTALEEAGAVRRLVQQNPGRGGQSHRPAGWKRRRPRPRLSHKGPMPF